MDISVLTIFLILPILAFKANALIGPSKGEISIAPITVTALSRKRSKARVTKDRPLVHRPCVVERKVKGKTLRTYGTLLDPRTNPRYMQKYGFSNIE